MAKKQNNIEKMKIDKKWEEAVDASMDIIAEISVNHEIINLNKVGCEILGKSKEEIIGEKCYKLVHGLDEPIEGCSCTRMMDGKNGASSEIKENGRIYITTSSPIYGKNDELISFAHTIKEITKTKKEELTQKTKSMLLENELELQKEAIIKLRSILDSEKSEKAVLKKLLNDSVKNLKNLQRELSSKKIALNEIVAQIEIEKSKIVNEINYNLENIVLPTLEKLKNTTEVDKYVKLLGYHLEELASSYGKQITDRRYKLTNREIEVCNLVKAGFSSKEIAKLLNIAKQTVDKHRKNIRQKLNITKGGISLPSKLKEI